MSVKPMFSLGNRSSQESSKAVSARRSRTRMRFGKAVASNQLGCLFAGSKR